MSEKIGIITFHRADNLGAVLQAYALSEYLNTVLGIEAEIIDYKCNEVEKTKYYRGKNIVKFIPMKLYYAIKRRGFNSFRKKYLRLSKGLYEQNNINICNEVYSVFITGSDQVWNIECSGSDYTYFLDFADDSKKRVAYAASIGACNYNSEELVITKNYILDFNAISVREKNVIDCLEMTPDTPIVPDPVFLLNKDEWNKLIEKNSKRKYVFVYLIQEDVNVMREARKYAKQHNYRLIVNKKSLSFILGNSPERFIEWIANAEAVFTNSFHGTAFSMIMHKKLGADIELIDGQENNRIKGMLTSAKLERCIISDRFEQPIEASADEWIREQKEKAYIYLRNSIINQ